MTGCMRWLLDLPFVEVDVLLLHVARPSDAPASCMKLVNVWIAPAREGKVLLTLNLSPSPLTLLSGSTTLAWLCGL
jgi:hypothetical protein